MVTDIEKEFLIQSNLIENVGEEGLADSIKAWEYAGEFEELNTFHVMGIHELLMQTLNPRIAGNLRKCGVSVGSRICPNWKTIYPELRIILDNLNILFKDSSTNLAKQAKRIHIEFEKLHPFEDGNGRVGRILYNWQRIKLGLDIHVIRYNERDEYYEWFETDVCK